MFSEKKPSPNQVVERNIIGKNTSLIGDIKSEGDFRIDGKVEGTIKTTGRVVIGQEGSVAYNEENWARVVKDYNLKDLSI